MRKLLALALLVANLSALAPVVAAAPASKSSKSKAAKSAAAAADAATFQQATRDYQAGKYQASIIGFEKYRERNPNNTLAHYYEALCYQELNQLDDAKTEFSFVIENDGTTLRQKAQIGLNQLNNSKATIDDVQSKGGPPQFGRLPQPDRLQQVLEFCDNDMCAKCSAFGTHFFAAATKFQHLWFGRVNVDLADNRVQLYDPSKKHPWVVFLDGSPEPKILWQGTLPCDDEKIARQIRQYDRPAR